MKHVFPVELDVPTAHRTIDRAFANYKQRFAAYKPELSWQDDRTAHFGFRVLGKQLQGKIALQDGSVAVEIGVPLALGLFKKKAITVVAAEIVKWTADSGVST